MIVPCPYCGNSVVFNGLGRKSLNIPLKIVCEALQTHGGAPSAARHLNCSEGYVYNTLKANGLTLKGIISGVEPLP